MDSQKSLLQELELSYEQLSIVSEEISDEELTGPPGAAGETWGGMELLFLGMSRFRVEGGPSERPMEVWFAIDRSKAGNFLIRSVRGRSNLASKLRTQALDAGIMFLDTGTGEDSFTPGDVGKWGLIDRATKEPKFLVARVKIDRKAGKLANAGRRFAYGVASAGVLQAVAKRKLAELPVADVKLLTAEPTEAVIEGELGGEVVKVKGKRR